MTVDPLPGLAGFARALAVAGLPVTTTGTETFLLATWHVDLADPQALYWAGRVSLCGSQDDLGRYDEAFAAWFRAQGSRAAPPPATAPTRTRTSVIAPLGDPGRGGGTERSGEDDVLRVAASDTEVLRHRDIAELGEAERAHLRELLASLRPRPPARRSLRMRAARHGGLDARRTLRAMVSTGTEPVRLVRAARASRPRRVVMLVDVSGSMAPYADALLRLGHVFTRASPSSTEVFSLGTRLTRLTRALRCRDADDAMAAAAHAVPDWSGGTRLGETLRGFLDRYGQRGVARGAVVVVCSDGWERGDTALLGEQMARLSRLAHTVLWMNPHAGFSGYLPVQSGIAAALPFVDKLLAGHSLATFVRLANEVRDA